MCVQLDIELLAALLRGDTSAVEHRLHSPRFHPNRFLAFTDQNHLSGYLHVFIADSPAKDMFPSELLDQLADRYIRQRFSCMETLREMVAIYDKFQEANQRILFIKGPFVAQRYYGDIHNRFFWDIDILVHRKDLSRCDQLLRDLGFVKRSLTFINTELMTRFTHTFEYRTRILEVTKLEHREYLPLDLHWCLQCHFSFRLDDERLWNEQEECLLEGRPFPVVSAEYDLVIYLLSIFGDITLGTAKLKNFVDLYMILKVVEPKLDWHAFFERRKTEKIYVISLNVFDLVLSVLDCRLRFPELARYIEQNRRLIDLEGTSKQIGLLNGSRIALKLNNRRWANRLYQVPATQSILWWLVSIPFKLSAYEAGDVRLVTWLRNRLQQ